MFAIPPRCNRDLYHKIHQNSWMQISPVTEIYCAKDQHSVITSDAVFMPITSPWFLPNSLLVSSSEPTSMPKMQSFHFSLRDPLTWYHFPSVSCYHFPLGTSSSLHKSTFQLHLHQPCPPFGISTVLQPRWWNSSCLIAQFSPAIWAFFYCSFTPF